MWLGISPGNWLTIAVVVGGGLVAWGTMSAELDNVKQRQEEIRAEQREQRAQLLADRTLTTREIAGVNNRLIVIETLMRRLLEDRDRPQPRP
jgi:flagellar motility protein MotE (MotC chaperone)